MTPAAPTPRDTWCLRFLSSGMRGRRIALKPGTHTLGSAPECEVLLPDTDARGQHLALTAGEVALTVRRLNDSPVELNGAPMAAERRSLVPGDVLRVGAIDMQIDREYAQASTHDDAPDSMFLDEEAAAQARAAMHQASGRWWPKAAVVLVLAAFGVTAAALAWRPAARGAAEEGQGVDAVKLRSLLRDYPEVVAQPPDAGGVVRLTGFVESAARQRTLSQAVRAVGGRVQVGVTPLDEVVSRAREFLADPGVAVSYKGQGHLQLSGASDQAGTAERVQRLTRDLYPMIVVDDQLHYKPVARAAQASGTPDWADRLPARVVSITEGPDGLRFVQLANGDRYFEGAPLRNGGALGPVSADDLAPPVAAPVEEKKDGP
ncbi:FHA domain-containing protein [Ideonella sp. DXS29W]|uniref:FHA domain-containing protein n=1 Tax=Ideonella lacteola TaxID=2984193 RepID=A0ABU9BLP2_9BURK